MKKNNRGQTLGLVLISSIFFFIIGMMMINYILPEIDRTRIDLSCSTPATISDGVKLSCLLTDVVVVYFIILIFSVVLGAITSRMYV
jgi:hypothetical protein